MPRQAINREIHSEDIKIEQKSAISDNPREYEGDVVVAHQLPKQAYLDELAFNEEPVTIMLRPTADRNAPSAYPIWVNGKGCEVMRQNGTWFEMPYLPVGQKLTIKRKYLEVIIRAKTDTVNTQVRNRESENPDNQVERFTSAVHNFDIIEDKNPKGTDWLQELRRRNF